MKSKLFASFGIGALTATISLGAIQYVSASGSNTITACANKSTGTMRYITKGSCKKTETRISWNQQGPQGLPGEQGAKGDTGARGDTGVATNGVNGQNLYAVDATGKQLGMITSAGSTSLNVLNNGGIFGLNTVEYRMGDEIFLFRDASCTTPLGTYGNGNNADSGLSTLPSSTRFILAKSADHRPTAAYRPTGSLFDLKSLSTVYEWSWGAQTCTARTPSIYFSGEYVYATDLQSVTLPSYTAPLSIVQQ